MHRAVAIALLLSGCADIPDLETARASAAADADFVDFLTFDELSALQDAPVLTEEDPLAARLARLRARAALLRGPIFNDGDRTQLGGRPG